MKHLNSDVFRHKLLEIFFKKPLIPMQDYLKVLYELNAER